MNETKKKRPSLDSLIRDGEIWWTEKNQKWVKCIPYNIKDKVIQKPSKEPGMNNDQFKQIMDQMISMEKRFNQKFDSLEKRFNQRFDKLEESVNKNTMAIIELKNIVQKNHPDDFR